MSGFLLFEGLVERENDYALIISLDSVNSSAFVEAYTPIPSPDSSTLSRIYLSACDSPDTKPSTYSNTTYTHADSTTSPSTTSPSDCLAPYTDLFLSAKKKYKPVAKKVRPVIGELPEKFRIERCGERCPSAFNSFELPSWMLYQDIQLLWDSGLVRGESGYSL
jgi:hypothetical protein